ncbi:MAG: ABC transporter permease [Actinomycetota bacterium]
MRGVPVGRRNLLSEWRRAFLGIAGVATAILLVLALDGLFAGAMNQITRIIDTSPADVFVAQRGVRNMHMATSAIPASEVEAIRRMPGVRWADPILYDTDAVVGKTAARQLSYVIGYLPGRAGGPVKIARGHEPGPGEIVIDQRAASRLGVTLGGQVRTLGASWRVSGFTTGLVNIVNSVSYVRLGDFEAARGIRGVVSFVLVGAAGNPETLAGHISTELDLSALSRPRFSAQERRVVSDMSTDLMRIMTIAAFSIGLAVIGLTLHAATLSRLREIGVMKALGARSGRLSRIVLSQAGWTIGAGVAFAVPLTAALGWAVLRATGNVTLALTAGSVIRAAGGAVVLGGIGAVAPLLMIARVDPMTVFRRQQ